MDICLYHHWPPRRHLGRPIPRVGLPAREQRIQATPWQAPTCFQEASGTESRAVVRYPTRPSPLRVFRSGRWIGPGEGAGDLCEGEAQASWGEGKGGYSGYFQYVFDLERWAITESILRVCSGRPYSRH